MAENQRAERMMNVAMGAIRLYFRLQAWGRELGLLTATDGSRWGMLHTLASAGPMTVPDIARMRPVSRQHIQALANEMAEEGLVEFTANPRHKRSKLVAATEKGRALFKEQSDLLMGEAATLAGDVSVTELEIASHVLDRLRAAIEERQTEPAD